MTVPSVVLVLGHATPTSGYGRVIHHTIQPLKDDFQFHHFGLNIRQAPAKSDWPIYPNREIADLYGTQQLPVLIDRIQPDLLLIVGDWWLYTINQQILTPYQAQGLKIALYCPIEGFCPEPQLFGALSKLDRLILFTNFGKTVMAAAFEKLRKKETLEFPTIDIIPHGLAADSFFPILPLTTESKEQKRRKVARQQLFPARPEFHQGFWILNANRHSSRKRLDITLEAFAAFSKNKPPDVRLFLLHLKKEDKSMMDLVKKLEIQQRVLTAEDVPQPLSDAQLNLIYNASEIGVNSSSGEGWGLIAFEHGATGAAQIQPRHSACYDLWKEHAQLVNTAIKYQASNGLEYQTVDANDLARQMDALYQDKKLRQTRSKAAYALANMPQLQWPQIALQWKTLMHQILAQKKELCTPLN